MLVGTAGVRESDDTVESIGIERAHYEAGVADLLLWLGSPSETPDHRELILIHPKADLDQEEREGLSVSVVTGEGIAVLTRELVERAGKLLPRGDELALDRRQHDLVMEAHEAWIGRAWTILSLCRERARRLATIVSRAAARGFDRALFGRFCLGT